MITIGPWLVGRVVLSRRRMTEQLQARNEELRAEQELFARESVRYERARIARELHDIVAHCLSVMVVQASAGQRVADADRDGMAEALDVGRGGGRTGPGRDRQAGRAAGRGAAVRHLARPADGRASSCAGPAPPAWR